MGREGGRAQSGWVLAEPTAVIQPWRELRDRGGRREASAAAAVHTERHGYWAASFDLALPPAARLPQTAGGPSSVPAQNTCYLQPTYSSMHVVCSGMARPAECVEEAKLRSQGCKKGGGNRSLRCTSDKELNWQTALFLSHSLPLYWTIHGWTKPWSMII